MGPWTSTRRPRRRCSPATISSCSGRARACASSKPRPCRASPSPRDPGMTARLLNGQEIGAQIRAEALPAVQAFTARAGRPAGLGIVLVGENPASEVYVRNKVKAGGETGLWVDLQRLAASASLPELLHLVDRLNASERHDGILVQSPLPEAMGRGATQ